MSLWKKISLGVLIFIVLLLGTVGSWWGRPPACIWFKAADRWVPGLEIGKVTGGWRDLR
jgi:translocation and assembly module TamB